jgi:hypothetical protein
MGKVLLLLLFVLFSNFSNITYAQNDILFKEIHIIFYEIGKVPCSKGIRYENGKYYYLRCEYGTEAQIKKIGRAKIDITTNLEVVNLIRKMNISDLEWLCGVREFHKKKHRCNSTIKKEFSITLKERDKNKTIRYEFPLVLNCEGKNPFVFVDRLNVIFSKLAKEFP